MVIAPDPVVLTDAELSRSSASLGILRLMGSPAWHPGHEDEPIRVMHDGRNDTTSAALSIVDDPDHAVTLTLRAGSELRAALFGVRAGLAVRVLVFDGGCVISQPVSVDELVDDLVAAIGCSDKDPPAVDEISPDVLTLLTAIGGDRGLSASATVTRQASRDRLLALEPPPEDPDRLLDALLSDGILKQAGVELRLTDEFAAGPGQALGGDRLEVTCWQGTAKDAVESPTSCRAIFVGNHGERRLLMPAEAAPTSRLLLARMRCRDLRQILALTVSGAFGPEVDAAPAPESVPDTSPMMRSDEFAAARHWLAHRDAQDFPSETETFLRERGLLDESGRAAFDAEAVKRTLAPGPSVLVTTSSPWTEVTRRFVQRPGGTVIVTETDGWVQIAELSDTDPALAFLEILHFEVSGESQPDPFELEADGELARMVERSWEDGTGPLGPCLIAHHVLALDTDGSGRVSGEELFLLQSATTGAWESTIRGPEEAYELRPAERQDVRRRITAAIERS